VAFLFKKGTPEYCDQGKSCWLSSSAEWGCSGPLDRADFSPAIGCATSTALQYPTKTVQWYQCTQTLVVYMTKLMTALAAVVIFAGLAHFTRTLMTHLQDLDMLATVCIMIENFT
jgi:hypothetical protein